MTPCANFRLSILALLWAGCLSGCQAINSGDKSSALSLLSDAKPLRLPKKRPAAEEKQTADLQFAMARTLEADGQVEQAIEAYRSAVRRDPSRTDALVRQAILYDQQGRFGESAKLYQQALQADPGNPDVFADVGYSFYLQDRLDEAETNLQQAIALDSGHQRARNNLGLVLARGNRLKEALEQFRRAGCTQADAHANVAFAMMLERRFDAAREQYRRALAVDPSSSAARTGLEDLETVLSKVDTEAEHEVARAVPKFDTPTSESAAEIDRPQRPRPDTLGAASVNRDEWFEQELTGPFDAGKENTDPKATPNTPRRISWMMSAATGDP